jgi:hypothetical protein
MPGDPAVMPKNTSRPTVEEVYHAYWGKVGGVGRLRRTFPLRGNSIFSRSCNETWRKPVIMGFNRGIPDTNP